MKYTHFISGYFKLCACCATQFENLILRFCLKKKNVDLSSILLILATVFCALWELGSQEVRSCVSYCLIYLINPSSNLLKVCLSNSPSSW